MNSHQRRKQIRRSHMLLPLGKEVDINSLVGRRFYVAGIFQRFYDLTADMAEDIVKATVFGHHSRDRVNQCDVKIINSRGQEHIFWFPRGCVKLKNPADRAARPWWSQKAINDHHPSFLHRAQLKIRRSK